MRKYSIRTLELLDENYTGGGAVYDDTAVSGYYFHIYHGEQHYGGSGSPFYSALGLAYSNSLTGPWTKLGEVISPQAAWVNGGSNCQAEVGTGTLLVVGSYFYVYYTDTASGCTGYVQLAVARASISSVRAAVVAGPSAFPTSGPGTLFMKYTGSGTWNGDGVTDLANPQDGGGAFSTLLTLGSGEILEPNVRYDSYLGTYILAYSHSFTDVEISFATDGLAWGTPTVVVGGGTYPTNSIYYPSLFNTGGGDPQTLGQYFSVFYVEPFNSPSEGWSGTNL